MATGGVRPRRVGGRCGDATSALATAGVGNETSTARTPKELQDGGEN